MKGGFCKTAVFDPVNKIKENGKEELYISLYKHPQLVYPS